MEWLPLAGVVIPSVTAIGVAWLRASRAAHEGQIRALCQRVGRLEGDGPLVRTRLHEVETEIHTLPVTLSKHFVERREWDQAQKAGDEIHRDHAKRISNLENGR